MNASDRLKLAIVAACPLLATSSAPALAQSAASLVAPHASAPSPVAPSRGPIKGVVELDKVSRGALQNKADAQVWRLRLPPGGEVQIDLTSDEFDTSLQVFRPGETTPLDYNDDNGIGTSTNSRLHFQAPLPGGDYFIRVTSANDRAGSYELLVRPRKSEVAACQVPMGGSIAADVVQTSESKTFARSCSFEGHKGQRIRISLQSTAFKPIVELRHGGDLIAVTDDSGQANALLTRVLPEDGLYEIRSLALGLDPGKAGLGFNLTLTALQPPRTTADVLTLTVDAPVQGAFSDDSPLDSRQLPFALYRFAAKKNESYTLVLDWADPAGQHSSSERLRVEAGADSPLGFAAVRGSTRLGGRPATISLNFQRDGEALIRVSAGQSTVGNYKLVIAPTPPLPNSGG